VYRGLIPGAVDDVFRFFKTERTKTVARGTKVRRIPNTAKKMASFESPIKNCQNPKTHMGMNQIRH
jgi:hypothetical protein